MGWPLECLRPQERNARTHSAVQVGQIATSIEALGFNNPILVDDEGRVIAGHGRLEAAKRLGMREVPVVVLDHLSPGERRAYLGVRRPWGAVLRRQPHRPRDLVGLVGAREPPEPDPFPLAAAGAGAPHSRQ